MRERERNIGFNKADLVATIITRALVTETVERLLANQARHAVGQLNLAARTNALGFQFMENFWLQNIAANNRKC